MYYSVDWKPELQISDDDSFSADIELKLDNEWSIFVVLRRTPSDSKTIDSIEIHRKNNERELMISGELRFRIFDNLIWGRKFSQSIRSGSSFTKIDSISYYNASLYARHWLYGHVCVPDNNKVCANGESKAGFQVKLEELSNDFKRLLDPATSCFSDVILKCGGASIAAHKNILYARSPVFAAMFSSPMKENRENEVDVTDIDASVLKVMLVYMYTGKCGDLTASSAADLLFAADKYQLQDLKRICCDVLKDTVSHQNVLRILLLGDLHSQELKTFAVDYICKQHAEFSAIETTEEWEALRKERPDLVINVFSSLVHSMNKKIKK